MRVNRMRDLTDAGGYDVAFINRDFSGEGSLVQAFSKPVVQKAVFDLAWPTGVQEELSVPIAVLLNEPAETLALASSAGFRCFTSITAFKNYVENEVLKQEPVTQ